MHKKSLISVIVPAYNADKTIKRCLNSIQHQTYKELEIIVVNDGSTDNTLKVLQFLSKNDDRIKIITIPNSGVSHARNVGIDSASGEYITFVDSDDYVDEEMYEVLIATINKYNVKLVHCSYKNVDENGNIISIVGDNGKIYEHNHDESISYLITGNLFVGGLWNKLYHNSLFSDLRLNENIKFAEDILMNFSLFDKVEKSVYIDNAFYNYVAIESSATHSANSIMYGEQFLLVSREIRLNSTNKSYEQLAEKSLAYRLLSLYKVYSFDNSNYKDKKKQILDEILIFKQKGFYSYKDKMLFCLCRYFPWLLKFVFRFYDKIRVKKLDPEQ